MIEWGTKTCPHCGRELEVVDFDDLDFVKADDAPAGPAAPSSPPVVEPITPDATPVVQPIGSPGAGAPATPPVVKPIAGKPKKPPIAKPTSRIRRRPAKPRVAKPIAPPVAKPIDPPVQPPLVEPLPEDSDLPPGVSSVAECPICGAEAAGSMAGARCGECEAAVCLPCLMRANGVKPGDDAAESRATWDQYCAEATRTIRCPACGRPGIR